MVEYFHQEMHPADRCKYASKHCANKRAVKRNGKLHNLCEYHREKASENQRRRTVRQKLQQFQDMQAFMDEMFTSAHRVDENSNSANAPPPPVQELLLLYEYNTVAPRQEIGYDPYRGSFRDDQPDKMYWSSLGHLTPIRYDSDNEEARQFTIEELEMICTLLDVP